MVTGSGGSGDNADPNARTRADPDAHAFCVDRVRATEICHAADRTIRGVDEVRIYNRALSPAEIQADLSTPVSAAK